MTVPATKLLESNSRFPAKQFAAVVFDAVGTVMYPSVGIAETYRRAIRQHCGVELSSEVVTRTVSSALRARSSGTDLRTDESTEYEFWATLIKDLCGDASGFQPCFDDLFAHFGNPTNWNCFPDVSQAISTLDQLGLNCAVASNFDRRLNSVCDGLPELASIKSRIISSEVGWRKPAVQFFAAVSTRLRLAPENILMVGDDLTNDVNGAIAAGMSAIWVCREAASHKDVPAGAMVVSSLTELAKLFKDDAGAACDGG